MNSSDLHWLAGWMEGEGSFTVKKTNKSIRLCGVSTDRDSIARVSGVLGTKLYGPYNKAVPGRKRYWSVAVHGGKAAAWMMTLYSLMGKRRQQAIKKALAVWRSSTYHQRQYPTCHPERKYRAKGLCESCYINNWQKAKRRKNGK